MNEDLHRALHRAHGVLSRHQVLAAVPRWVLEHAVRAGQVLRVCPQVYVDACRSTDPSVRRRAALVYGSRAAGLRADETVRLSHTSALAAWGLHKEQLEDTVHVTIPAPARLRSVASSRLRIAVHRRVGPLPTRSRHSLPLTSVERSLVDSWPLLPRDLRRATVITAVNDRMTTPERLQGALVAAPRLPGRRELVMLVDLLAAGCRSELELWGHQHVFTASGMPHFRWQFPVRVGRRTIYLDVLHEETRTNFELDGAASHGTPHQRERDLRRDAELAMLGILVVRFSHRRLMSEQAQIRREVLAILAARRSLIVAR